MTRLSKCLEWNKSGDTHPLILISIAASGNVVRRIPILCHAATNV